MYDEPLYDDVHRWTFVDTKKLNLLLIRVDHTLKAGLDVRQREIRSQLRRAQRFVLDDDYVRLAYRTSLDFKNVPTWLNLARLPYPTMWFEWDQHVKLLEQEAAGMLRHPADTGLVAQRGGFLFQELDSDTGAWMATRWEGQVRKGGEAFCSNIAYAVMPEGDATFRVNPPPGVTPIRSIFKVGAAKGEYVVPEEDVDFIDTMIEGLTFGIMPQDDDQKSWQNEALGFLRNRIVTTLDPIGTSINAAAKRRLDNKDYLKFAEQWSQSVQLCMQEDSGILRFIVTVLAMLNAAPTQRSPVKPQEGYRTMGMHRLPYLGHDTIHVTLPKAKQRKLPTLLRNASADARRRRAHMTRGHWRQVEYGKKVPFVCDHNPTLVEDGVGICTKCERIIRWIPSHKRGDENLGWVTHDYVLEAR